MNDLPIYINLIFVAATIITIGFFYKATSNSRAVLLIIFVWVILQTLLAKQLFYTVTNTMPPRLLLLVVPPLLIILLLFATAKGRMFIDNLNIRYLTILHCVRILVEIVLLWLSMQKVVPQLMTFEGRNFDILAGITAPLIYYFGFVKNKLSRSMILLWNFICLGLLLNIVVNAVLSVPTTFQQFAFDQPNIAILYFPFNLLPAVVVPLVLLSHLAAIRQLLHKNQ